jgi:hypothetical protein
MSTALIVRVKRRRSVSPSNELVVVEDGPKPRKTKKGGLSALSLGASKSESEGGEGGSNGDGQHKPRKLVLRRMGTVKEDSGDRKAIDVTKKRGRAPSMEEESGAGVRTGRTGTEPSVKKKPNVFVTRRRRVVRSNKEGEYVVVDLSQIAYNDSTPPTSSSAPGAQKQPSLKRTMVLNPPDRHLENALHQISTIELARRGGSVAVQADFNPLLTALMQGGNVNLQTRSPGGAAAVQTLAQTQTLAQKQAREQAGVTGKTALMLACYFANHRVASRLVARGADVFLTDSLGRVAMDYLHEGLQEGLQNQALVNTTVTAGAAGTGTSSPLSVASSSPQGMSRRGEDLVLLLHKTASKSASQREALAKIATSNAAAAAGVDMGVDAEGDGGSDDYVVDIFAIEGPGVAGERAESSQAAQEEQQRDPTVPMVAIEGLRIDEASHSVEFVEFDYDSDWSDLGDDEDPDSNDERYHGNDYPEDEESAEEEEEEEEEEGYEDEDEDEEEGRRRDPSFRGNPAQLGHSREGVRATGHVVRPQLAGGGSEDFGNAGVPTPESILRRWQREEQGDDEDEEDEDEDGEEVTMVTDGGPRSLKEHRDRLRALHEQKRGSAGALGPQFAANPREFGRDGLPKYGGLSGVGDDDEEDDGAYERYGYVPGWDDAGNALQFSRYAEGGYGDGDEDEDEDEDDGYRMGASGLPPADSDGDGDYDGRSTYSGGARVRYARPNGGLGHAQDEDEDELVAQARAARAFYNGLRDSPARGGAAPMHSGSVFRLSRGVAQNAGQGSYCGEIGGDEG